MVMNTESKEVNRNNGKKSHTTSPLFSSTNAKQQQPIDDLTPETSEDEDNNQKKQQQLKPKNGSKSEFEEKIRVGKDYQAIVPPMKTKNDSFDQQEKALLVWAPAVNIPDSKVEEYVTLAKERYGYNTEQALGMLFWHKHDMEKAVIDLGNFTPFPEDWNKEDVVLFEQAFQFHGKCFHRIRQMLPDKSIASLVKFYYSWKKTRSRTSVMDRQEKRKNEGASDNASDGTPDNSDMEDKKWTSPIRGIQRTSRSPNRIVSTFNADNISPKSTSKIQDVKRIGLNRAENNKDTGYSSSSSSNGISKLSSLNCQNCKVHCNEIKPTPMGGLCSSCFQHWRRTGSLRPVEGPNVQRPRSKTNKLYYYQGYHDSSSKYKRKPPKGMYINHDDVLKLASQDLNEVVTPRKQPVPQKFDLLADCNREINVLYSQIQTNKQKISSMKKQNDEFQEARTQEEIAMNRAQNRWTKDELALAIMGFKKFGQNFKAISEVISTKTESHVRKFFAKYRKSRNLDVVIQESQANNAQKSTDDVKPSSSIEVMEIDSDDDVKSEQISDNGGELLKVQGKASIVVTNVKALKRKLESEFMKEESDDENPHKKIAPLLEKAEITITPIQKAPTAAVTAASTSEEKQNGSAA